MFKVSRADESAFGRWWWTVDRWLLGGFLLLIAMGIFLVAAASPAVAMRIGLSSFHFVYSHVVVQIVGVTVMLCVSMLSPKQIRLLALFGFTCTIIALMLVPLVGEEIKGARRWIHLPGFSLQPSEFLKPTLAVVTAWLFAKRLEYLDFPGRLVGAGLYVLSAGLLLLQPDLGMTVVITTVWCAQFFLTGVPIIVICGIGFIGICGLVGAYFIFSHVTARVDKFLHPEGTETYQIDQSLEAFHHGGIFGTGPGQGQVKFHLPDAHADFIFSVAGEELGLIWTIIIVVLFMFIVIRGLIRALNSNDLFTLFALTGLLTQFGLQALIHMASSLSLIPTKGMTLPFLSYGGSSSLGLAFGMGMVLALTRRYQKTRQT